MNIFGRAAKFSRLRSRQQILLCLSSLALFLAVGPRSVSADQDAQAPAQADIQSQSQGAQAPPYAQQTPEQLQQLVAPIALYPDSLVAQVLAASTFPEEVVEADRWVQAHPDLQGDALGQAVDQQSWDPSVKALAAFPSVLGNMDKNLSWTSSLGDAYYNQQQDVMDAVQVMRQRAQQSGNLKTTPQQTVATQGSTIVIQPANPQVVYVPAYDPWMVYGGPVMAWPGWYPYPGIWYGGPYLSFGAGFGIGFYGGYGWGWSNWGFNWGGRYPIYNHNRYYSRSNTFYNRGNYYRGNSARGGFNGGRGNARAGANTGNRSTNGNLAGRTATANRPTSGARPFNGNTQAARGYAQPRGQTGTRSGAFSGYDHGGQARSYSSRGSASVGGGAPRGGGGGGAHGGGGSHGGGRPR
ncbi:MAG: DUF3300 domain-containing protein [Candidatus Acidiferrales bacterium]